MAPKRLQRQRSTSTTSSNDDKDGESSGVTAPISTLSPKPCYTCGREITPRAKWARNWPSIRYCSDHCKGWKSVIRVGNASEKSVVEENVAGTLPSLLERSLVVKGANLMLHFDAWVEGTMLELTSQAHNARNAMSLSQVSESLHKNLAQVQAPPPHYAIIKNETLQQNPGEREMIRRAARRLVILDPESWAFTQFFGPTSNRISLTQNKGKLVLSTLKDVSFAKGEMYIQQKKE